MRHHYTPARMSKIQDIDTKCSWGCGATGTPSWLMGMQNGAATLRDSLEVSYKAKGSLTMWLSSHTPWYLPKWAEDSCTNKNMHTNVDSSFIHNHKYLEATNMSFHRWMGKLWYIQTMKYYSVIKRKELSCHEKTQRNFKYVQAHRWDIAGLVPDHCSKRNIAIKQFFWFPSAYKRCVYTTLQSVKCTIA